MNNRLDPKNFNEFIGQEKIKKSLEVFIKASKKKHKPLDHICFYGDAGCGKTTLAYLIAKEMGTSVINEEIITATDQLDSKIIMSSGATLKKPIDIITLLHSLTPNSILFIDEIHALSKQAKLNEVLYPAMEDFKIEYIVGEDENAKPMTLELPPFTLIGATTNLSMLAPPLRSRFRNIFRLVPYNHKEMCQIIIQSADKLKIKLDKEALDIIATASRNVPRLAKNLLKSANDYAIVGNLKTITKPIVLETIKELGIRPNGITDPEIRLLKVMVERYGRQPVGLNTMAQLTNEEKNTIVEIYEPFLIQTGFLLRTPQGRVATPQLVKFLREEK